jgi:methionine-gamma-lyase
MKKDKGGSSLHRSTKAIHGGKLENPMFGEISVPIFQNSTFSFPNAEEGAARFSGEKDGYIYTRMANPTINALEENIASLENGYRGMATATGMAAINTIFLAKLTKGDHIVSTDSVYGPTRVVLETVYSKLGIESTFVDSSDLEEIKKAICPNTRIVYAETPANPTMKITDIRGSADIAHENGAILVVDSTFASPHLQRPIDLGADVVVHSITKFINGHTDVVGGMIVVKDKELYGSIKSMLNLMGGTMDPHQAWLVLRGVQTLPLRIEKGQESAMKLAKFLKDHPNVTWVKYPGLEEHPQHELAKRQMDGFGAMLSFGVKDGIKGGVTVMNNVGLFTLAVSLGGLDSLIEHPASMTHASLPRQEREESGILDELIRVSTGCEDYEDLRADLEQALDRIS